LDYVPNNYNDERLAGIDYFQVFWFVFESGAPAKKIQPARNACSAISQALCRGGHGLNFRRGDGVVLLWTGRKDVEQVMMRKQNISCSAAES
jgi:hypothetical protein